MAGWHATGHRHVPMLRACLYASSTAAFSRRVLLSSGRPAMLAWNRASWLSHHKPSRASSRWFCSSSSFASFSANTGRQGSSTQRNAAQAALELSQRDWLTALTPPQCQPQEQEEDEEVVAALSGLAVSDAQRGEDAVVAGPNVLVIGIDPDVSGAMAVLHGNDVTTAEVFDVPSLRVMVGSRHRRRHDTRSIVSMIKNLNAPTGSVAYIEQSIPLPKDGRQGWWGSGFGYGIWIGTLVASGISVVPVPSSVWKRAMGLFGKSVTKDDCRACASSMFPSLASKLKRKKDHGRAEALLIAAHGKGIFAPLKASPTESGLDDVQSSENDYQNGCLLSA